MVARNTTEQNELISKYLFVGMALAGCGGGTGTGGFGSDLVTAFANLDSEFAGLSTTPTVDLPMNASASYVGIANLGINSDIATTNIFAASAFGEMSLEVDLGVGAGTMTGSIDNFQFLDLAPVAGSVDITNGTILGNQIVSGDAIGTVGGRMLDYDIDGEFQGSEGLVMFLFFDGTSTSDGITFTDEGGVGIGIVN